jgi:tetratricopeptide (TPR) repeat protein
MELNPNFPEARAALGRTYLVEDDSVLSEGIAELEHAVALLPSRKDLLMDLSNLYERKGNRAKSEELLRKALGSDAEPILSQRRSASEFQESLDRVNALLAQRKEEEAIALAEKVLEGAPAELREILQEQVNEIRKAAAARMSVRRYNEAVDKLNRQDLLGSLAAFESVAANAQDPSLVKAAQDHAERIRQVLSRKRMKSREKKGS